MTHLSKKTAKLNRSASPEKPNAVLPVIPIDEADRRKALYTGIAGAVNVILPYKERFTIFMVQQSSIAV